MTTTAPLEFWRPEDGERQLRVFISYRYEGDEKLYDDALRALIKNGFPVQDVSLPAKEVVKGPRGGRVSRMKVQSIIAARIYTSDVLIAPSRPAVGRNAWVTWEVQLAAVGYGIPILFVDQSGDQQRNALIVSHIRALGLPHRTCKPDASEIVRGVAALVNPRPDWAIRPREDRDSRFRFRGPPTASLDNVLKELPLTSRFPAVG